MKVRIYSAAKTAMQSGRAREGDWVLEAESGAAQTPESVMGWTSMGDTNGQIRICFARREEAEAFARKKGWEYTVQSGHERSVKPRNYADNFRYLPPEDEKQAT